ncbi:MAG: ferritin family protein [Chloroflexi bacterium]|nr:ferritin family protein [Chloroflexota bacterium]
MPDDLEEDFIALQTAMQIERDGYAFYTSVATTTADAQGKAVFRTLAEDELSHLRTLESAYQSLAEVKRWPPLEQGIADRKVRTPPIFPKAEKGEDDITPTSTSAPARGEGDHELSALRRGIQAERDSIAFYTEAAAQASDPSGKVMYQYLIEEEEGHLLILQGEYDYLTRTGHWFGIPEFDLEAEG